MLTTSYNNQTNYSNSQILSNVMSSKHSVIEEENDNIKFNVNRTELNFIKVKEDINRLRQNYLEKHKNKDLNTSNSYK